MGYGGKNEWKKDEEDERLGCVFDGEMSSGEDVEWRFELMACA